MAASGMIAFTIPGPPGFKGRPRFRIVKVSKGRKFDFVQVYTDAQTAKYEADVGQRAMIAAARARQRIPLEGVLELHVIAVFQRPKRLMRKKDPDGRVPHDGRVDADNVLKAVMDGMNKVIYADDKTICKASIEKYYQGKADDPIGVHVVVKPFVMANASMRMELV